MKQAAVRARLYLDEDILPDLARLLYSRGEDVISAHDVGMRRAEDSAQLEFATDDDRAIVTSNVADFVRLSHEWTQVGRPHAGIILSHRQIRRPELGVAARRIQRLLEAVDAAGLRDTVQYLDSYRS